MSPPRILWQEGEKRITHRVDAWLEGETSGVSRRVHESGQRVIDRLEPEPSAEGVPSGSEALIVKVHRTHSGPHRLREAVKQASGFSPARREWRALRALHAAGASVPEPLARGRLPNGDPILVMESCGDHALRTVLESATPAERLEWIDRLVDAVEELHSAGYRHGDLHLGNLHVQATRVVILDLQSARRARSANDRLQDLAHLDFSMARAGLDLELRRRLRSALGDPPGLDAAERRFIRDFVRGRSRRTLRIGRSWAAWRTQGLLGIRESGTPESALEAGLARARAEGRPGERRGGRTAIHVSRDAPGAPGNPAAPGALVVKCTKSRSPRVALLDRMRGSPAHRGFRAGQRLALLGEIAARPLAALDERRHGLPMSSWLILQHVGQSDLDHFRPDGEQAALRCLVDLARWIAEWHAWGIDHRDLKAGNIRIEARGDSFRFWLIDLEDLRLRAKLGDAARCRALVQLNASLADEAFSLSARKLALDAYVERLPFRRRCREALLREIARKSLERNHHWRGGGCEVALDQAPVTVSHWK